MHKRLLFAKEGDAIWISHLDLMRVFQRAFRRAGMLLRHSQGYTPHAYVSILLPMSVGVSSQCEVLDYELDPGDTTPEAEIPAKLNACLPAGIRILASYESEKKAGKLGFLQARLDLEYDSGNAPACRDAIREFGLYCWDERATGDRVRKEHDHAMDDIRYFAATVAARRAYGGVGAWAVERQAF